MAERIRPQVKEPSMNHWESNVRCAKLNTEMVFKDFGIIMNAEDKQYLNSLDTVRSIDIYRKKRVDAFFNNMDEISEKLFRETQCQLKTTVNTKSKLVLGRIIDLIKSDDLCTALITLTKAYKCVPQLNSKADKLCLEYKINRRALERE